MTREEQINKAVEDLLDEAEIDILDRPLLRMWYKLGVNFADKNPIDRTDWQQVRIQAAIAAMQGFCNICHDSVIREIQGSSDKERSNVISFLAVRMADALVKELKEK